MMELQIGQMYYMVALGVGTGWLPAGIYYMVVLGVGNLTVTEHQSEIFLVYSSRKTTRQILLIWYTITIEI